MRLVRRILALLVLAGSIVLLVRYRQNVEAAIIEKTFDAVAYAHAVEEEAASKLRQLPQVILPFHKTDESVKPISSDTPSADTATSKRPTAVEPIITTLKDEDGAEIKDVGAFWAKWSRILHDARPTTATIKLSGHAPAQKPPGGEQTRKPYKDLVRQTIEELEPLQEAHKQLVTELETELGDGKDGQSQRQWKGLDIFRGRALSLWAVESCTLPVEVFVPDDDEYEAEICDQYLKKLDAKCVVLSHILDQSPIKTGAGSYGKDVDMKITHYQLKALALLLSSFSDALLLDSDSIPLFDPAEIIFNAEPYQSKGMIIWPDFWRATESPKFWTIAGRTSFPTDLPATSSETGQLAINKATHLAPLLLATYYNLFGPDHYYPLQSQGALGQGDKETFLAAVATLNATYYRVRTSAVSLGRNDGLRDRGTAMVQHSPADDFRYHSKGTSSPPSHNSIRAMFLHSNTPKMNAGHLIDEGDLVGADGETRLRLLGTKEALTKQFGYDVEKTLWDLLVQTGCELQGTLKEWKERERICERLDEHYKKVFG
ncbi:mannosyltransferase [Gnomoniopsis smithogilvyi]|uniref:Mannosyltransferase n=1 Tax=Gnomoniopsis smithogilvyi TaxID=1191159 RepID=A0A9W8YKD3_9PEZI|nr:mannosyltransferase [Gnomoniopsis smithogilvyi]